MLKFYLSAGRYNFAAPARNLDGDTMLSMDNREKLAKLAEDLVCPVCRKSLTLRGEESFKCNECRRVYPIRDGIPMMMESYATVEPI